MTFLTEPSLFLPASLSATLNLFLSSPAGHRRVKNEDFLDSGLLITGSSSANGHFYYKKKTDCNERLTRLHELSKLVEFTFNLSHQSPKRCCFVEVLIDSEADVLILHSRLVRCLDSSKRSNIIKLRDTRVQHATYLSSETFHTVWNHACCMHLVHTKSG